MDAATVRMLKILFIAVTLPIFIGARTLAAELARKLPSEIPIHDGREQRTGSFKNGSEKISYELYAEPGMSYYGIIHYRAEPIPKNGRKNKTEKVQWIVNPERRVVKKFELMAVEKRGLRKIIPGKHREWKEIKTNKGWREDSELILLIMQYDDKKLHEEILDALEEKNR